MEKLHRTPAEVDATNPGMTIAEQCRLLAAWRLWNRYRAEAMEDVD